MKYIKNFKIFEATGVAPDAWAGNWRELPEWKLLELMGFSVIDINRNGTITIHSAYSGVHPRITSAGYVRTAAQGYVYQYKGKDPMPKMLGYVIMRFAKKGISDIPIPVLDDFMKNNPAMIKYLIELPKLKEGILARTGISDPLGELYKKYGLSPSSTKWLDKCSHKLWEINETTGKIDVHYNFTASGNKLGFRGVKFGVIDGAFDIGDLGLTSLEGAPDKIAGYFRLQGEPELHSLVGMTQDIGGDFYCDFNGIKTLEGCPEIFNGNQFNCTNNQLLSLEGAPIEVKGNFNCTNNNLTSLKGGPQKVGGDFVCHDNPLSSLEGAPLEIGGIFRWNSLHIKWDLEGWIEGLNKFPELFGLLFTEEKVLAMDINSITPKEMELLRKNSPEGFAAISKRIGGDSASTIADLGELGF